MKKIVIIGLTIMVMFLIYNETREDTIVIPDNAVRLRVIPNSNSAIDQNMKGKVKAYLEDNTYTLLKDVDSIDEARLVIKNNIPTIEKEVGKIFDNNNYDMKYDVNYGYNYFPQKEYRGVQYDEGYYESIVVSIGEAKGDNWWCVLFPNLCLADLENQDDTEYKLWITEALKKIF